MTMTLHAAVTGARVCDPFPVLPRTNTLY